MNQEFAIGIDLGATKIAAALVSVGGEVIDQHVLPTLPDRGEKAVLADIAYLINSMQKASERQQGKLLGVGIGSPGHIYPEEGVITNAVNLGWQRVDMVKRLYEILGEQVPIWVQKDANAAAMGEYYFGAARNERDFLYLSIGSGLGGGAVSSGRLILGARGSAAEAGHISLDPQSSRICVCGLPGCSETTISGPGLQSLVSEILDAKKSVSSLSEKSSPNEIVAAARQGDETACAAINIMARHLGIVLSHAVSWFNPGLVVLGGGLGLAAFDLIVPVCLEETRQRTYHGNMGFRMVPSSLKSSAVGAASLVWYSLDGAVGCQLREEVMCSGQTKP